MDLQAACSNAQAACKHQGFKNHACSNNIPKQQALAKPPFQNGLKASGLGVFLA
jgi:hypothetical protein